MNKKLLALVIGAVLFSIIYRVQPYRIDNFNPLLALSLFGGFVFNNNKKWAFAIPVFAMLASDIVYQLLYINNLGTVQGFYGWWQIANYASINAVALVGFYITKVNAVQIGTSSLVGAILFFILSNFFVWAEGMGYQHSYTFSGLLSCYGYGLPFFKSSLISTISFSAVLFGIHTLITNSVTEKRIA
jgi:uncharacterized membrane protein YhhN